MSVRASLLAILDQGPCYGYQLRGEFERRTGRVRPLNVGQIYNTLERLERDGMVARGEADDQGHVFWQITRAGSDEARDWLTRPVGAGGLADELVVKLALAATLRGVEIDRVLAAERAAAVERRDAASAAASAVDPEALPVFVAREAARLSAVAELDLIDRFAERIASLPHDALVVELSTERPKRGRPARVAV